LFSVSPLERGHDVVVAPLDRLDGLVLRPSTPMLDSQSIHHAVCAFREGSQCSRLTGLVKCVCAARFEEPIAKGRIGAVGNDGFGRLEREPLSEHGESSEYEPFRLFEVVMAPVDRRDETGDADTGDHGRARCHLRPSSSQSSPLTQKPPVPPAGFELSARQRARTESR
jgi:hypothetical protein